jgi:hypothetical protein
MNVSIEQIPSMISEEAKSHELYAIIQEALWSDTANDLVLALEKYETKLKFLVVRRSGEMLEVFEKDWRDSSKIKEERLLLISI